MWFEHKFKPITHIHKKAHNKAEEIFKCCNLFFFFLSFIIKQTYIIQLTIKIYFLTWQYIYIEFWKTIKLIFFPIFKKGVLHNYSSYWQKFEDSYFEITTINRKILLKVIYVHQDGALKKRGKMKEDASSTWNSRVSF